MTMAFEPSAMLANGKRQRAHGRARIEARLRDGVTVLSDLYQHANAKFRLPKTHDNRLEAVLINTAGGLTGGDTLGLEGHVGQGGCLLMTTQACERIYRSVDGSFVDIRTMLHAGANAHLVWLPQETILFDGGRLERHLQVELDVRARFTGVETVMFGRPAMGEVVNAGCLSDRWTIRRNGRLLHADRVRIDGAIADQLPLCAVGAGGLLVATLVHVAPDQDELETVRQAVMGLPLYDGVHLAASALPGRVMVRLVCSDMRRFRSVIGAVVACCATGLTLPTVWRM